MDVEYFNFVNLKLLKVNCNYVNECNIIVLYLFKRLYYEFVVFYVFFCGGVLKEFLY